MARPACRYPSACLARVNAVVHAEIVIGLTGGSRPEGLPDKYTDGDAPGAFSRPAGRGSIGSLSTSSSPWVAARHSRHDRVHHQAAWAVTKWCGL